MPTADNRKRGAAGIRWRLQANSAVSGLYVRWQLKKDSLKDVLVKYDL
jgi:hypothetical protein